MACILHNYIYKLTYGWANVSSFTPIPTIGLGDEISTPFYISILCMILLTAYKEVTMRSVKFSYLRQAIGLLKENGMALSNKRLRRCAYLDVHQNNYKSYKLYNNYKKIMNSDAANNQTVAIIIVVAMITIIAVFFII